jgi:HYR domain
MPNYAAQATTSDNCGAVTVTQSPAAGSTICNNNGGICAGPNYTVTLMATDASGNTTTCSFNVEVKNNSPLVINCLAAQNLILNVNCTALLPDYRTLITATDLCLGTAGITINQSPAPGTVVTGTGVQVVTFTATLGNKTTNCNVNINKIDNTPPVITCPTNVLANTATGLCTAIVNNINASATDGCSLASVTYTLTGATTAESPLSGINNASGLVFNKGVTNVNYIATDGSGNVALCSFTVTVNDTELPKITCPANITRSNDVGVCGAIIIYTPPVGTDNCPGATTVQIAGLSSGSIFPIGITTNTYQVTDGSGNVATCSFTITITDTELPKIICPANISKTNDAGICGAVVTFTAPVGTDNCPNPVTTQIAGLPSGSLFPIGITTNTFKVTDSSGNIETCSFTVEVKDTEAPSMTCPNNVILYECSVSTITPLVYSTTQTTVTVAQFTTEGGLASDNCLIVSYQYQDAIAPSTCGIIVNRTWTVTDQTGNLKTCVQVYTINDKTPPVIATTATSGDLGCNPTVTAPTFTATDNCLAAAVSVTPTTDGPTGPACARTQTWTANYSDACTNAAVPVTVTYTWKEDVEIPVIATTATSGDLGCNPTVTAPTFTATDNCLAAAVSVTPTTDGPTGPACARTQTWTANYSDACTNTAVPVTVTYTWKEDLTPPTIICPEIPITVTGDYINKICGYIILSEPVTTSDNCTGLITKSYLLSGATILGPVSTLTNLLLNTGKTTVSVTALDACGNV